MTERSDLIDTLRKHRGLFRLTVQGLTDDQARERPTVSELTLGGLIKHVSATEASWADFVVNGPGETPDVDWANVDWSDPPPEVAAFQDSHRMLEHEGLADLLTSYEEVATATEALIESVDLDEDHALPEAPWNAPGERWSNRRVFVHLVAETAQHAGHADILRETIDGQKSMG